MLMVMAMVPVTAVVSSLWHVEVPLRHLEKNTLLIDIYSGFHESIKHAEHRVLVTSYKLLVLSDVRLHVWIICKLLFYCLV